MTKNITYLSIRSSVGTNLNRYELILMNLHQSTTDTFVLRDDFSPTIFFKTLLKQNTSLLLNKSQFHRKKTTHFIRQVNSALSIKCALFHQSTFVSEIKVIQGLNYSSFQTVLSILSCCSSSAKVVEVSEKRTFTVASWDASTDISY